MEREADVVVSPAGEVPVIEGELVTAIQTLAARGVGTKAIARALGVARNTVRRYRRASVPAGAQTRPRARRLTAAHRATARQLYAGPAAGNAVVVQRLLAAHGCAVSARTIERAVADLRRAERAAALATVRIETPPGEQLQVDFGQKLVEIAGHRVRLFLLVAVLSYSRRIFVRAFLHERGAAWREGIAAAFVHFGGLPRVVLGDNARPLVRHRDRATGTVVFHPAYLAFCRDGDVQPRACAPYRARTKGKTEAGVKYVKRNGLAGLAFASFAALEQHLAAWVAETADVRVHGTTHETPRDRFDRAEREALRPLPRLLRPPRELRLTRRVAADAFVDVDTVRYSVPHRFVRESVEIVLADDTVTIWYGPAIVATHQRVTEPHARVVNPTHYDGLWRPTAAAPPAGALAALGRDLATYASVVTGGAP